jgi:hypothetical protein
MRSTRELFCYAFVGHLRRTTGISSRPDPLQTPNVLHTIDSHGLNPNMLTDVTQIYCYRAPADAAALQDRMSVCMDAVWLDTLQPAPDQCSKNRHYLILTVRC